MLEKYPHARPLLRVLENPGEGNIVGNGNGGGGGSDEDERDDDGEEEEDDEVDEEGNEVAKARKEVRIKFGIDATKLTMGKVSGRKKRKKGGTERGFDKIGFNFPHVGGKTKDVNRQVRFNQGESFQVRSFISLLVRHNQNSSLQRECIQASNPTSFPPPRSHHRKPSPQILSPDSPPHSPNRKKNKTKLITNH